MASKVPSQKALAWRGKDRSTVSCRGGTRNRNKNSSPLLSIFSVRDDYKMNDPMRKAVLVPTIGRRATMGGNGRHERRRVISGHFFRTSISYLTHVMLNPPTGIGVATCHSFVILELRSIR
jgi:hypothetical protein